MVRFVLLLQPAQNSDCVLDTRLAHEDHLKPALECRVLLDVLAVLIERRRSDHPQFTARKHRLEHVAGIHRRVASCTRANDRVQFVDEGNDLPIGLFDLFKH